MKQFFGFLLACCLLAGLITLSAPTAQAAEHTDHCVCGGSAAGVADHMCEGLQWKPLSDVVTLTAVDFKNVPSGHYYLDADATVTSVTDSNAIGQITADDAGNYSVTEARQVSLCLNGHTLSTTKDRVFKGIYMDSVLNICDCSGRNENGLWQWSGKIVGGSGGTGTITYIYANSQVNIYGGNLTAKPGHTASTGGGLFYVAQDRSTDSANGKTNTAFSSTLNIYNGNLYGGSAPYGGNIAVAHTSNLNIYGGYIHDGTATVNSGGNIRFASTGSFHMSGGALFNGTATTQGGNIYPVTLGYVENVNIYGGYPEAVRVIGQNTRSQEYSLSDALKNLTEGSYLQLQRDLTTEASISGTVYLDMNGHDLSGVTVTGTVYGFDSATDGYSGQAGALSCTVDGGQIISHHKTSLSGDTKRYLTVPGEDGTYSFHRFYIGITAVTLRPGKAGMGYKATFAGDEAVKNYLSGSKAYGYQLWIHETNKVSRGYSASKFGGIQELTLVLNNILSQSNDLTTNSENAQAKIHAVAYIQTADGQRIESTQVSCDFKDMIHRADAAYADYNTNQQAALQTLGANFSETMMTWDVENFHHADGSMWRPLDQAAINSLKATTYQYGTSSKIVYCLPAGSYVLTEDLDLSNKTLGILPDAPINLCLNGHTVTGNQRMMRIYGTLNLCDCHEHGADEGGMTSSYTNTTDGHGAVFYTYYNSIFNLYGGNLKAEGTLASSGVGAVSHEKKDEFPDAPAGVMNMYGGTISGGKVTGNGGLMVLYHGGSFRMYGGELYGGQAAGSGGAVCLSSGTFQMYGGSIHHNTAGSTGGAIRASSNCQAQLYGGSIYDCSASLGGGVYFTGNTQRYMGPDMTIRDNAATEKGNDVYLGSDSVTTIDGSTLKDIHVHSGAVALSGQVDISAMYLDYLSTMDAEAMSSASSVKLQADVYGFLSNNTTLKSSFILEEDYQPAVVNGMLVAVKSGLEIKPQVEGFRVGHGSVCIDPAVTQGIPLSGFGNSDSRRSTGVQESLYASATAITDAENNTLILITCDLQRPQEAITNVIRQHISRATGVPFEKIIISSSHSHSTPDLYNGNDLIDAYKLKLYNDFTQAAVEAMASRVVSHVEIGGIDEVKTANGKYMNFTRHYYYEDAAGNRTYWGDNFGSAPSGVSAKEYKHVAEGDHSMQLIRFDRDSEKDVVLCNWAAHPTMTGGASQYVISADYVGPLRDKVQENLDCYFSFVQGAAGNMNTTSRVSGETPYPKEKYHEYGEALADFVIEGLNDMQFVSAGKIQTERYVYEATVQKPSDDELERAKALSDIYYTLPEDQRKNALAEYGFTSIYHAGAVKAKSALSNTEQMELNVFSIGDSLGFYSLPGELWAESALKVKAASDFACTFTLGYTNGDWKYFPDGDAADMTLENSYENYEYFYCRFTLPDTTQKMIAYWQEALSRLYQNAQ